jgi:hypothetical protein
MQRCDTSTYSSFYKVDAMKQLLLQHMRTYTHQLPAMAY